MMDVLMMIYDKLTSGGLNNIKFYEYPAVKEVDNPKIIIDPIDSSLPSDYADNQWMTLDYEFQIDVWGKDRQETESIADKIRNIMWDGLGFYQQSGPKEYEEGIFRDARRYRGKIYRQDDDSL